MTCVLINVCWVHINDTLSLKLRKVCYISFNFTSDGFVTIEEAFYKIPPDVEQIFVQKCKSNLTFSIGHRAPPSIPVPLRAVRLTSVRESGNRDT